MSVLARHTLDDLAENVQPLPIDRDHLPPLGAPDPRGATGDPSYRPANAQMVAQEIRPLNAGHRIRTATAKIIGPKSVQAMPHQSTCAVFDKDTREDDSKIAPDDPMWDQLSIRAAAALTILQRWLEMDNIYGDLAHVWRLADAFEGWHADVHKGSIGSNPQPYLKGV